MKYDSVVLLLIPVKPLLSLPILQLDPIKILKLHPNATWSTNITL